MSTELSVEDGNRVIERDEHGNVVSEKVRRRHCSPLVSFRRTPHHSRVGPDVSCPVRVQDYTRVQAGYKAATHNKSLTKETRQVSLAFPFSMPPALALSLYFGSEV